MSDRVPEPLPKQRDDCVKPDYRKHSDGNLMVGKKQTGANRRSSRKGQETAKQASAIRKAFRRAVYLEKQLAHDYGCTPAAVSGFFHGQPSAKLLAFASRKVQEFQMARLREDLLARFQPVGLLESLLV